AVSPVSLYFLAGFFGDAGFPAFAVCLKAHAGRLARFRVGQRHIRGMDRGFLGHDAARIGRGRALLLFHHVAALDDDAVVLRHDFQDFALLAFVFAGQNDYRVTLFDFHLRRHYSTSWANEIIFMKSKLRSSRVTGPKIRVPIGWPSLLIRTQSFLSKRMLEPSGRLKVLLVRTTTARNLLPFCTLPRGIASLTDTT